MHGRRKSGTENIGVITLFIRPQKQVRKRLSEITDAEEFQKERNNSKDLFCSHFKSNSPNSFNIIFSTYITKFFS